MVNNQGNPMVSVLMPNYNNAPYLADAVKSILNQKYEHFELIVVDDASTDNSWKILQRFQEDYSHLMKVYRNEKNEGVIASRERAREMASEEAKYYAIMDSDDIAREYRLSLQVETLEKSPALAGVGSSLTFIDEDNEVIGQRMYPKTYEEIKHKALFSNPIAQPSLLLRKTVFDSENRYRDILHGHSLTGAKDYDLWLRILQRYPMVNIRSLLLDYRISANQIKSSYLKETIRSTITIQKSWLRSNDRVFNKRGLRLYILIESALLLLPERVVKILFILKEGHYGRK